MNQQHATGAASELVAASYFAGQGYTVLFPFVTQSRYDLVVEKDGNFQKVQVKTATWNKASSPFQYLQCRVRCRNGQSSYEEGHWDTLAVVKDEMLWLFPWDRVGGLQSLCLMNTNPNPRPKPKTYDPDAHRVR